MDQERLRRSWRDLPAFDLALAITWEETRGEQPLPKLTTPWLTRVTTAADITLGEAPLELKFWLFSEFAREVPGLGLLPRIGGWAIDKTKRAYLERTRRELKELYRAGELKKPYELSALLPWMLAHDLNHHLAAHPQDQFILFIDEYERVCHRPPRGR